MSGPSEPVPHHASATPSAARLDGSVPVGARARRTLWTLALGHLALLVTAVLVAALLVGRASTDEGSPFGGPVLVTMFAIAALALVAGQILSLSTLSAVGRAMTDHIDVAQIARSLRRSGWSVGLVMYAVIFGVQFLLTVPGSSLLVALFLLLMVAALLLEYAYAGWATVRMPRHDEHDAAAAYRLLPPGIGPRLRRGQSTAAAAHALFAAIAAALLVVTVVTEVRGAAGLSPAMPIQIAAAAAAVVVPLLQVRTVRLVRASLVGDWAHLPALRRAGASFRRAGQATALLSALVIVAVAASPNAGIVAAGRAALTVFVLCAATLQFASLSSIYIGDFPKRWIRHPA